MMTDTRLRWHHEHSIIVDKLIFLRNRQIAFLGKDCNFSFFAQRLFLFTASGTVSRNVSNPLQLNSMKNAINASMIGKIPQKPHSNSSIKFCRYQWVEDIQQNLNFA